MADAHLTLTLGAGRCVLSPESAPFLGMAMGPGASRRKRRCASRIRRALASVTGMGAGSLQDVASVVVPNAAVQIVRAHAPPGGLYAVAALAGATDVDPITLSMTELSQRGED